MIRTSTVVVVALLCVSLRAVGAELDGILVELSKKWVEVKSVAYDLESRGTSAGQGFSMSSTISGNVEAKRKDQTHWQMRVESTMVATFRQAGHETNVETKELKVLDGEYCYTLTETFGKKSAFRRKVEDNPDVSGGSDFLNGVRAGNDLKLLPEKEIDGTPCYVFKAVPRFPTKACSTVKYYMSKETALNILAETLDSEDKLVGLVRLKKIKINLPIADERFVFKAPAGVEVEDVMRERHDP
jgi:outer membrane lipoprotein-sorting protein